MRLYYWTLLIGILFLQIFSLSEAQTEDDADADYPEPTTRLRKLRRTTRKRHKKVESANSHEQAFASLRRALNLENLRDGLSERYFSQSNNRSLGRSQLSLFDAPDVPSGGRAGDWSGITGFEVPKRGYIEITGLQIQDRKPVKLKRVDKDELVSSISTSFGLGRQDFDRIVMAHRPPECVLGDYGKGQNVHPLTWAVARGVTEAEYAYEAEFAAIRLANGYMNGNGEQLFATLERLPEDAFEECFAEDDSTTCNAKSPYRTFDGRCNNLKQQSWGSAKTGEIHAIFPAYEDGIASPREISVASIINKQKIILPSARAISVTMSGGQERPDAKMSMLASQFAQFVAHDLINTPMELVEDPNNPKHLTMPGCCHVNPDCRHPSCFPIIIPQNDPFYSQHHQDCMEFVRSQPANPKNCKLTPRSPVNLNTHFLDASMIYGSNAEDAHELRGPGGRLRINDSPAVRPPGMVMPPVGKNSMSCQAGGGGAKACMASGDSRVNQHTGLISITALFIREHNRIADYIGRAINGIPEETIYQVTRRIVTAQIQYLTFNELLPLLLGTRISREPSNGLALLRKGHCENCYDPNINPSIAVEFGAAAWRMHTINAGWLPTRNRTGGFIPIYEHMLNPELFYKENIVNEILSGFVQLPSDTFDPIFAFHMQNNLFRMVNKPYGLDQLSFNIQRGRDHGVPSYVDVREACGLPPVTSFADLEDLMSPRAVQSLAEVYAHVRDIDLYAGGISEYSVNGGEGIVGPTFACIIADQFARLRHGDRFWYENKEAKFKSAELDEIRKTSLSALLCGNHVGLRVIQPRALLQDSPRNPRTPCEQILGDSMSLEPFIESITPTRFPAEPAEARQKAKYRGHGGPSGGPDSGGPDFGGPDFGGPDFGGPNFGGPPPFGLNGPGPQFFGGPSFDFWRVVNATTRATTQSSIPSVTAAGGVVIASGKNAQVLTNAKPVV